MPDVSRLIDVPLEEDLGTPEVRLRLAGRAVERFLEPVRIPDDVHPLATAPERRLDEQGVPDARRLLLRHGDVDRFPRAGHDRDPSRVRDPSRGGLVPHPLDRPGWGTHEGEPGLFDGRGEMRPLREEPVPGVDQRGTRLLGRLEDRPDRQVGVGGEGGTEPVGLVRHLDVEGVAVGIGVDGDGGDPHLPTRPQDAHGDLAAVRDEQRGSFRRGPRHSRIVLPCDLNNDPPSRGARRADP